MICLDAKSSKLCDAKEDLASDNPSLSRRNWPSLARIDASA